MEDIKSFFREGGNKFTIYVVEQKFVIERGRDYFKSFLGKDNYIDTNVLAQRRLYKIYDWIEKKIPPIADLIKIGFDGFTPTGLVETIVALNKLFGSQVHQAAGPEVIDPIIIQEGKVIKKCITKLVNLHKDSFLSPTIIILLKDNNFERAKELLSECPNGIHVKFIRNSGKSEIYKIINTGAENINHFIDSFAEQSFSTCSRTKHDILLNKEWAENSIVKLYAPQLLKYRANLLCDEKIEIKQYLNACIKQLEKYDATSKNENILKDNFLCIAKLYRVFCNDVGGNDIHDAYSIATNLNNELLKSYVYKYAYFFQGKSLKEQDDMLNQAYHNFMDNNMFDNAIYCKNNRLVRQFDNGVIKPDQFAEMIGEATSDVPGLVGMSHIYNNTGIAFLMSGRPERVPEFLDKGLDYTKSTDRQVQHFAILCNKLIAKSYYNEPIEFTEIEQTVMKIFDGMVCSNLLPFISARYIMNLLVIAIRKNTSWGKDLLAKYNIVDLFKTGLDSNALGTGQLLKQIDYVEKKLPGCNIKAQCPRPSKVIEATGRRKSFIEETGLNPFYFFTWL